MKSAGQQVFNKSISLGNLLTMLGMAITVGGFSYTQGVQMESLRGEVRAEVQRLEGENQVTSTRVDFIASDMKRRLERIENKLDRITDTR